MSIESPFENCRRNIESRFEELRRNNEIVAAAVGDGRPTKIGLMIALLSLANLLEARTAELERNYRLAQHRSPFLPFDHEPRDTDFQPIRVTETEDGFIFDGATDA